MTHERIPFDGWERQKGHVKRYEWVRQFLSDDDVADIGCGIGYGAKVMEGFYSEYHGYDRVAPAPAFFLPRTSWHYEDFNRSWEWSYEEYDTSICFEVLEHVENPALLAAHIANRTTHQIFVSVPVIPTREMNEWHLHDFTVDDIPPMFPGWRVADEWAQPEELSHVWRFVRE